MTLAILGLERVVLLVLPQGEKAGGGFSQNTARYQQRRYHESQARQRTKQS
jgi:hypothetical protein